MTTQEVLTRIFIYGSFYETLATDEETTTSPRILAEKKFIKLASDADPARQIWIENKEVTDKILYPNAGKPICGFCQRQGSMSCHRPYCGHFCDSTCLVAHTHKCRACAISIAMEK